jgi:hypothetical protein
LRNPDALIGQQSSAGGTAGKTHLFLDSQAQVLHQVEAISHLMRLRRPFSSSLRVKSASISAINLDRGMLRQPSCNARYASVGENVQNRAPFKIDDYRAVAPRLPPAPVIYADHASRGVVFGMRGTPLQMSKDGIVADGHPEPLHQSLAGAAASIMAKHAHYLRDPACPTGIGGGNRWDAVSESPPFAEPICATPPAQLELHRHDFALDWEVLKTAV